MSTPVLDLLLKGGWVMFPILALSVGALAIILERSVWFLRIRGNDVSVVRSVESAARSGGPAAALDAVAGRRGPLVDVLRACLASWERGPEAMADAARLEGAHGVERLEARLRVLSMLGQAAPLLGLLGTVTGMIGAFMVIERGGRDVDVSQLAGGIWEALLTTAFGLIVAIPVVFAYSWFEGLAARHVARMETAAEILVAVRKDGGEP